MEQSLGDRIVQIRRRRSLTQAELAEAAGVSLDVITKLEGNRRAGARVSTLHAIARALKVKTSELLEGGGDLDRADNGDTANLLALRKILVPSLSQKAAREAPNIANLRAAVTDVTRLYHESRYQDLLAGIPDTIQDAEAAVAANDGDYKIIALRLLAQTYNMASLVLLQLRREDLSYEAARRSMTHAESAGDPILRAAVADNIGWIFQRQARFDDAEETVITMADAIEPSWSRANANHIAVWGRLLTRGASSAARNNRPEQSREFLSLARSAAARLGQDHMTYGSYWAAFGPTTVDTIEVENAVIMGEPDRALSLARSIRPGGDVRRSTWARYLLTLADAQAATRNPSEAVRTLRSAKDYAPEWLRYQRLARRLTQDLLESQAVRQARNLGLPELAEHMNIQ
ncbi:helix-turn-helix domain-containing protein [Frankia sp. Cr1]|uniref:helix-turn-helix domain-containing protein n=1 Tax=Frankia sp. Cr1 TaxID=3073931 RepID=UPI002AD207DA|nr:helix-turn-helix domain-containing protein [Frankia sp. Cr1]